MDKHQHNLHKAAKPQIFKNAKALRKRMTPAEQKLWQAVRAKKLEGYKFRRQHPIKKFILDFYCHEAKLGIELDGEYHENAVQKFYDTDRSAILEELGILIIRFSNREVLENLEQVLKTIKNRLA